MVKNVIAACLLIGFGVILTLHFALFWIHGELLIGEENRLVLGIETAMAACILGFGLYRFYRALFGEKHPC